MKPIINITKTEASITYGKTELALQKNFSINKEKPYIEPLLNTTNYQLNKHGNPSKVIFYLLSLLTKRQLRKLYYCTFTECSDTYIKLAIYKALSQKRGV